MIVFHYNNELKQSNQLISTSECMLFLQIGHELFPFLIHSSMHVEWNKCLSLHLNLVTF